MKRIFQLLLLFWVLSILSPKNNAMETNRTCNIPKGNISEICHFIVNNSKDIQTQCNSSLLSTIFYTCNRTGNQSCCQQRPVNSSTCEEDRNKTSLAEAKKSTLLVTQIVFYAIVFLVGVIGNLLVILTVTSKRMRSVRNMLIGNLAVADLITLLVCLPISIITTLVSWPFGTFICRYIFSLSDVVVSVSILTICVITMDRFRAIVYPFAKKMTLKVTSSVIVVLWAFSYMVVALPLLRVMNVKLIRPGHQVCTPLWPSMVYQQAYRLTILLVLYVIPVALVFFCFICIVRRIRENIRFTRETVRDKRSLARIRRRSRVVKMMFVIFLTFTICLLPIHLLLTLIAFYTPMRSWPPLKEVYHVALIILIANSAMNPIILYLLSSEFKRGFREHCICFVLFMKIKDGNENHLSKPSRSFNNQQLTTCLHLAHGQHEMTGIRGNGSKSHQQKELLSKHNDSHRIDKCGENAVETML